MRIIFLLIVLFIVLFIFLFTDVFSGIFLIALLIGLLVLFVEFLRFALGSAIANEGITLILHVLIYDIIQAGRFAIWLCRCRIPTGSHAPLMAIQIAIAIIFEVVINIQ